LDGVSATEKFTGEAAATVTVIATLAVRLPEVPWTVNAVALIAAELAAVSVSVLVVAEPAGLNDAVTPVGKPVAAKATVPPNPPSGATLKVAVPAPPTATFTLVVEEPRVKPGAAATVKGRVVFAETPPETAVMVNAAVATDAEALAVSVSLLVVLVLAGLKAAVTPVGSPPTVRLTAPVKPFTGVTVMVLFPDVPCVTLRLAGAAANVTPGAPFTVRPMATEAGDAPVVPITVTVAVPGVDDAAALNVTMLVVAVVAGLNETVMPPGSPVALRVTLPLKPVLGVTVIVSVAPAPCTTLSVAAEAANEKFAGADTVTVIATVAVRVPDLPVIVALAAPTAAAAPALKVKVLTDDVLAGLNDAVTPLGRPETVRLTALLNPFAGTTAIPAVPPAPCGTLTAVGVACRLKPGAAVTCRLTPTLALSVPETPCTETV
jgi:hypothetical protein